MPILAAYWFALRRLAFDRVAIATLLSAFCLSVSCLFHPGNWTLFSTDWVAHSQYVQYIADFYELPPAAMNGATRHPPAYYILAACFYHLGVWADEAHALDYVRYLALICFSVFWIFAAGTLRRILPAKGGIYHLCLAMLAFWPVGITKALVIGNDILLYPAQMAVIYYLVCWLQTRDINHLRASLWATAIALLAKNNALVLLAVVLAFLAFALWQLRRHIHANLRPSLLIALAAAGSAAWLTCTRSYYVTLGFEPIYTLYDWIWMYLYFDPIEFLRDTMINPFSETERAYHFWHYYLRSLLVGDYISWRALAILFAYGFVWLGVLGYTVYGLWARKRLPAGHYVWHFLLGLAALLTGMLLYRYHSLPQPNQIADGRYVYPIIVVMIGYYGKALEYFYEAGNTLLYRTGRGLALGFVFLSLCLILSQDYLLTRIQ